MKINEVVTRWSTAELVSDLDPNNILEIIKTNCREYLNMLYDFDTSHMKKEYGKVRPLWLVNASMSLSRSKKLIGPSIIESSDDRKPADANIYWQKAVDRCLRAERLIAVRSNSIFCSGSAEYAHEFGNLYKILPFDGFKFTWGTRVEDLYTSSSTSETFDFPRELEDEDECNYDSVENSIVDDVRRARFSDSGMRAAIFSGHEIYIHGKCLAIPATFEFPVER